MKKTQYFGACRTCDTFFGLILTHISGNLTVDCNLYQSFTSILIPFFVFLIPFVNKRNGKVGRGRRPLRRNLVHQIYPQRSKDGTEEPSLLTRSLTVCWDRLSVLAKNSKICDLGSSFHSVKKRRQPSSSLFIHITSIMKTVRVSSGSVLLFVSVLRRR